MDGFPVVFLKDITDEDICATAIMSQGDVAFLFDRFKKGIFVTADKFCYYYGLYGWIVFKTG